MLELNSPTVDARELISEQVVRWRWMILMMLAFGTVAVELALATPAIYADPDWVAQLTAFGFLVSGLFVGLFPGVVVRHAIAVSWGVVLITPVQISMLVAVATGAPALPLFYAWPLLTASFLLTRREFAFSFAFAMGTYAIALLPTFQHSPFPVANYSLVVVATAVTLVTVRALSETINRLFLQVQRTAQLDPLTDVLNRRSFHDRAAPIWQSAMESGDDLTVLVLDLDHFKSINDRYGHAAGDAALEQVGELLKGAFRGAALIARTGGEEFAVLFPHTTLQQAIVLTEQFRDALRECDVMAIGKLTVSIGIAARADEATLDSLLAIADRATYRAKTAGRDRVEVAPRRNDHGPSLDRYVSVPASEFRAPASGGELGAPAGA